MEFDVSLLSNSKKIYKGKSKRVVLPTQKGIMDVLPHHVDFVVNLTPGIVKVETDTSKNIRAEILNGVAYKQNHLITILVDDKVQ